MCVAIKKNLKVQAVIFLSASTFHEVSPFPHVMTNFWNLLPFALDVIFSGYRKSKLILSLHILFLLLKGKNFVS